MPDIVMTTGCASRIIPVRNQRGGKIGEVIENCANTTGGYFAIAIYRGERIDSGWFSKEDDAFVAVGDEYASRSYKRRTATAIARRENNIRLHKGEAARMVRALNPGAK